MAKRYSVSPVLRPGAKTFSSSFRNCFGARVTRSLETSAIDRARQICGSLFELWNAGVRSSADVPVGMLVHPEAHRLYFGERSRGDDAAAAGDVIEAILPRVQREVLRFPEAWRAELFTIIYEQLSLRAENGRLRDEVAVLKRDLHVDRVEMGALKSSVLGRAAATAADMPRLGVSVQRFTQHIRASVSISTADAILALVDEFKNTLPTERVTMMDVRVEDIGAWLDGRVAAGKNASKKSSYRDALRRRLGRFVNWCASEHDYPSQMGKVPAVKKNAVARERGDIHWHELGEVQRVLKGLPDDYWRAVVGALAYAGLQLAELVWLRVVDVDFSAATIWVTTVVDDEDASVQHALKTAHRCRSVRIHPRYLLPLLKRFKKQKLCGKHYFFALPVAMRRPHLRTVSRGSAERWIASTLTQRLLGRYGLRDEHGVILPKMAGLLPAGMNAKSLRRTFGSLLLRSGKTTADVAAAMGNTEDVVREYYARILGCEVDVDF